MLGVVRIVLPELLHGEPIEPGPELAEGAGTDAEAMQEDDADTAMQETDGTSTIRR